MQKRSDQGWKFKLDYVKNHGDRVISKTFFTMVKLVKKEVFIIFTVVYVRIQCYYGRPRTKPEFLIQ